MEKSSNGNQLKTTHRDKARPPQSRRGRCTRPRGQASRPRLKWSRWSCLMGRREGRSSCSPPTEAPKSGEMQNDGRAQLVASKRAWFCLALFLFVASVWMKGTFSTVSVRYKGLMCKPVYTSRDVTLGTIGGRNRTSRGGLGGTPRAAFMPSFSSSEELPPIRRAVSVS